MTVEIALFVLGFVFLIKGADILVDGASSIGRRFGLSTFFIGLTIVAFGTSLPELIVSTLAGIKGSAGLAMGNIIGSNISNTLLILGVSAMIAPIIVKKATVDKEIPFSLLAVLALVFLVNDMLLDGNGPNGLTRIDGLILLLFFIIFLYYTFGISKEKETLLEKAVDDIKEKTDEYKLSAASGMIVAGLAGLYLGGRWIVSGAISMATYLGVSEALIGLTIVAVGTSLPELAASAVAAYKGRTNIAIGNVVGSNVFNILWVLGLAAVISPISFEFYLNIDFIILIFITILVIVLVYVGKKNVLDKREGITLIAIYVLYIIYLIIRG
ncbi:calcium/sodium antiporter [Candidatus Parcubacteria bacterium]|nr:calcium/sodium antiporter [Candidatus Parcubacteria bacterium]